MIESVFPGGLELDVRLEARTNKKKKRLLSTSDVFVALPAVSDVPDSPPFSLRADLHQVSRNKRCVMSATLSALHFLTG